MNDSTGKYKHELLQRWWADHQRWLDSTEERPDPGEANAQMGTSMNALKRKLEEMHDEVESIAQQTGCQYLEEMDGHIEAALGSLKTCLGKHDGECFDLALNETPQMMGSVT